MPLDRAPPEIPHSSFLRDSDLPQIESNGHGTGKTKLVIDLILEERGFQRGLRVREASVSSEQNSSAPRLDRALLYRAVMPMEPADIRRALVRTYTDVERNHTMQMAAALSYYFVLSLFPASIFLSAVVAYLPVPDLFNQALTLMARFLPVDSMVLVRRVLADVVSPNKGTFLSFGILGTLWAASGGFAATIEALNIAYEVRDDRPFWKTRPLAVGLAFMTSALLLVALSVMIVGPRFGEWLATRLLGVYFRHFANFNKTYGTLGAAIALMVWLYWTGFSMLLGAELNAELAKASSEGRIQQKHEPPSITRIDLAA
jgi:uncharacterized BrkB/YihY/UPF0761 family membrane protein